jgi:hypothetical protein
VAEIRRPSIKEDRVRKRLAILPIALSTLAFAGCNSGITVEGESPVDIPEQVEVGGVTVRAPEEVNVGEVTVQTEDGRVTAAP